MISGSFGEDYIVANDWARHFSRSQIRKGDHLSFPSSKPSICPMCNQSLPVENVIDGEIFITLYNFKDEELDDLNKEYDLIYKIQPSNGGFGPVLVGGKRYTC